MNPTENTPQVGCSVEWKKIVGVIQMIMSQLSRLLLFHSGFENLAVRRPHPFFSTVLKFHGRIAGFVSRQYLLEILKVYFHLIAFVVFKFHGLKIPQ